MQFPVVLRYTPTKLAEAQDSRHNSPSKFITLNYQQQDPDSASPSPTRVISVPPSALAHTARKRYLQPLSADGFEKSVYDSLHDMANYEKNAATKPLSVMEANWYLDVTNVAQRLKLLRETYKVIQSVRKKKMMGERADFQNLFDLRFAGDSSPFPTDDDRQLQRTDDDDDSYSQIQAPPIPNRRGRPRKKRGVDRKPATGRSDHKRTRASLRRTASEVPSSPAERSLPTSEAPEAHYDASSGKSGKEDLSSSQNEWSATPGSPPKAPAPASLAEHFATLPTFKEPDHVHSSLIAPAPPYGAPGSTDHFKPFIRDDMVSGQESMINHGANGRFQESNFVPIPSKVPHFPVDPSRDPVKLSRSEGNLEDTKERPTTESSEFVNDVYSRESAQFSTSTLGDENDGQVGNEKEYSALLRELDQHFMPAEEEMSRGEIS